MPDRLLNQDPTTSPEGGPTPLGPLGLAAFNSVFWPYLVTTTALAFFPTVGLFALSPIDKKRNLLRRFTEEWGAHYLERAPFAGVTVIGRERIDLSKPAVFVANHESMVDILAIMSARLPALWVSKVENFYAPVLGFNMLLNGYIPVRRGYLPSILRMVRICLDRLADGRSLIVFPEGTRSDNGQLRPFFRGAFMLAARANVPIIPIVHVGTRDVLSKGSFVVRPRRVTLKFLDPIHPELVDNDSRRLRDLTREIMVKELDALRGSAG
ncbi:MAG: lysophospholipid acyltransferase family protein [Polyangiaceae bacterium]